MNASIRMFLFSFLFAAAAMAAPEVKWLDDFSAAKAAAQKEGKPILVDFSGSDWCGWCIKLDKEVFSQKAFLDYAGENLILFLADYPRHKQLSAQVKKQNDELQNKYRIEGFPTVLLLNADGKVLAQTGYQPGGAEVYVKSLRDLLTKAGWKAAPVANPAAKAPAAK